MACLAYSSVAILPCRLRYLILRTTNHQIISGSSCYISPPYLSLLQVIPAGKCPRMDPLSVSASVAGLITLAELIVSRGYEFLKGVKNAKTEITQLLTEVAALFGVLQSLRLVALRFEGQRFNTTLQLEYLQSCQKLVDRIHVHLKSALPEDSDGRWRAAGKSLRWPLSDKETKALIADVGRHKATLSLALNADGLCANIFLAYQLEAADSLGTLC